MDDHLRLSELTGIARTDDGIKSFWPINLALFLLGVAVLVTAFYFLDPRDARLLHNPWTYAVATPVILLTLSALLSMFVSRLVEKSMQLAFLLSMLIHLGLLVYAVNIVIFSRMWPDILESLAQQRQQLQRETLQAKQYHRLASSTQTGRKPDYLRHVATQHQPTEAEHSKAPSLQLAPAEVVELVSPAPDFARAASPHLLPRPTPSLSTPTSSEQTASLSRSELQLQLQSDALAHNDIYAPLDDAQPAPVQPQRSDSRRDPSTAIAPLRFDMNTPSTALPPASSIAQLSRSQTAPLPNLQQPLVSPPRDRSQPAPAARRERIDAPQLSEPASPQTLAAADATSSLQRHEPSRSHDVVAPAMVALPSPSVAAQPTLASDLKLQRTEPQTPAPTAGIVPMEIAKDAAGGRPGQSAPASMPVYGAQSLASNDAAGSQVLAPARDNARRPADRGASSALPTPGLAQGPQWNGTPSMSAGVAGRSPSQISREQLDGLAAAQDIAALTGAARNIERSSLGLPLAPGTIPLPATDATTEPSLDDALAEGMLSTPSDETSGEIAATPANPLRVYDNSGSLSSADGYPQLADAPANPLPSMSSIARNDDAANSPASQIHELQNSALARDAPSVASPTTGSIAVPILDNLNLATNDDSPELNEAVQAERRGGASRSGSSPIAASILQIDDPVGQGGLAPELNVVGPLLARRMDREEILTPQQIDASRFARQDVGGPLGAGQKIAVPQPAFQQRLDRLQDRRAQDQTALGPQTELAIERGLSFLAAHQREDGSWRLQDFDTQLLMRSDTAATGLALLAFQGAGYTHQQFKYADAVDKALKFLIERQTPAGDLYIRQDPASDQNAWLYSHAIASLALCEAYGMTQDPELRTPAQQAVNFMLASQDPQRGGWRYRPGLGADTSVTGWFMMALKSGQLANLEIPAGTFKGIEQYVLASQASEREPYLFRYNPYAADTPQQRHGLSPTAVMTSVGLLMRLYLGWDRSEPRMIAGADHLLDHLPSLGTPDNSRRDTYYWYYATQVMFHMRGYHWKRWHDELYPLLINNQVTQGDYAGSWDPVSPTPDLWARYGGRLYVTTMNLLSLEVSYRHLPLYEATAR